MVWYAKVAIVILGGYAFITRGQESLVSNKENQPPEDCNINPGEALDSYSTVEDFVRCAPFLLTEIARIYFQGGAGRQWTLRENRIAFERLRILPKVLRDVSKSDLSITILGNRVSMPILAAPVAYQKLASNLGEIDTARAASEVGTIMVLSSIATTLIEDVASAEPSAILWMQVYIFPNRSLTINLVRRAEANGFQAIVVTVDSPILGSVPIDAREVLVGDLRNLSAVNVEPIGTELDASITFQDLTWLVRNTRLPVVAKGILSPEDALEAARCGVAAVLVSNHGGRQLDYVPASIDALPKVAQVLKRHYPFVEVYMDGGVRNGLDVFKALALGARAVFIGRPVIWGLAAGGQNGVSKIFNILRAELNQTMMLAGIPNLRSISRRMILHERKCEHPDDETYPSFPRVQKSFTWYNK